MNDVVIVNGKRHCLSATKEYVLSEFKDVFEGISNFSVSARKFYLRAKVAAEDLF